MKISARDPEQVVRYRFGQTTADFLVCSRCGIYLAALLSTADGSAYATLNVNCSDRVGELTQSVIAVSYEAESASERIARRIVRWTPACVEL